MEKLFLNDKLIIFLLCLLSAFFVFAGINLYPLFGDEYQSIIAAKNLGSNIFNLNYFFLLNLWMRFGNSEIWLRSLSAIFGIITVIILYFCGKKVGGRKAGLLTGFLSSSSPFLVYQSQQLRFYSFFIMATALFMLTSFNFLNDKKSTKTRIYLILSGLLLLFSHAFSLLVISAQLPAVLIISLPKKQRIKAVIITSLSIIFLLALGLVPSLRSIIWGFVQSHSNTAHRLDMVIRPVSLINFLKLPFTFFIFTFGYSVYPFFNPLLQAFIALAMLLVVFLSIKGSAQMFKIKSSVYMPAIYFLAVVVAFIIIDPFGGAWACGLEPRHVAFAWPVFIICLSVAISKLSKKTVLSILFFFIIVNLFSLVARQKKLWLYSEMIDYRKASELAYQAASLKPMLMFDGQGLPIDYYFPKDLERFSLFEKSKYEILKTASTKEEILIVKNNTIARLKYRFDEVLKEIEKDFYLISSYSKYPFFGYLLKKKPSEGFLIDASSGQVRQPITTYGVEFKDLELPLNLSFDKKQYKVSGEFSIGREKSDSFQEIPLSGDFTCRKINLLSNMIVINIIQGQKVAEVILEDKAGKIYVFPLRLGIETQDWSKPSLKVNKCETVYTWRKLFSFTGRTSYPGAWEDFSAGIYGSSIEFNKPMVLRKITFRYTAEEGELFVWGLGLG
ncbi:MAG: glycosyltransferase family 39 protein [Candidatus Omnitrophica bacterium]|nr:glycosyltransferase family 39 protein [Candidatus Omnitrophota bacterium]